MELIRMELKKLKENVKQEDMVCERTCLVEVLMHICLLFKYTFLGFVSFIISRLILTNNELPFFLGIFILGVIMYICEIPLYRKKVNKVVNYLKSKVNFILAFFISSIISLVVDYFVIKLCFYTLAWFDSSLYDLIVSSIVVYSVGVIASIKYIESVISLLKVGIKNVTKGVIFKKVF